MVEKVVIFVMTVIMTAGFFFIFWKNRDTRARIKALAEFAQTVIRQQKLIEKAMYILMAYKHYYDCSESGRPDLETAAKIGLLAVVKQYADDPHLDFLKDEVTYD